jgi:hypothetical protein
MSHSMSHCAFNAIGFHWDRWTIPMPTSWQTTSCIRPRNPAGGRRALPERDCAGGGEWFQCRRLELPAVFTGYFQWEWRRELVSCSLARIGHGNRQIPANLKCFNRLNRHNTHNRYKCNNRYNYHSQDSRMFPVSTRVRIVHHCIWYDQAPKNWTEQTDSGVWLNLAVPMSPGEHLPEK